jgi:hypothetical protein
MCDGFTVSGGEDCYGGSLEFHRVKTVQVRKPRWCEACKGKIPVGAFASYITGKYEGDLWTLYLHLQCRALFDRSIAESEGSLSYDEVLEALEQEHGKEIADTHKSIVCWSYGEPWVPVEREEIDG